MSQLNKEVVEAGWQVAQSESLVSLMLPWYALKQAK
jgi:hypothetical protein